MMSNEVFEIKNLCESKKKGPLPFPVSGKEISDKTKIKGQLMMNDNFGMKSTM